VLLRKYGQEIIQATAGKKIHGTGAIPGGINKNLTIAERDVFLKGMPQILDWSASALKIAQGYTLAHMEEVASFAAFDSNHLSIVRADGAHDIYDGGLRATDANGSRIFDHVDNQKYAEFIAEEVKPWSYMKFPFIRSLGPDSGWYRVGPLARVNNCDFFDTPRAEKARREFMALTQGRPNQLTMAYHWSRMIELLHSAETIERLLHDPDLQGNDLVTSGERREEAVGIIEAPRGTLFHHYQVDDNGIIKKVNLIIATGQNNLAMNRAVRQIAARYMDGGRVTEGVMNRIEAGIRMFDPCLSCSTHAAGSMALHVRVLAADGALLDERRR